MLTNLDSIPEDKRTAVRNNGGGHANHTLFWEIMGPNGGGEPVRRRSPTRSPTTFGGVDELKAAVNDAGVKRFGSGWTWLVWDGTGLAVKSTPNQDSPVMDGQAPLLGIDVWEHAYYLQLPEPAPRLPRGLVERRRLGRGRVDVRCDAGADSAHRNPAGSRARSTGAWLRRSRSGSPSRPATVEHHAARGAPEPTRRRADRARRGRRSRRVRGAATGATSRAVLGLALRRLGDRGRAEDATQDAFVAIWRSARTYDPERGAGAPWLYAVARNAITDGLRRTPEPAAELAGRAGRRSRTRRPGRAAWTAWRVHRALEVLPEHERPLIELAYWGGLSQSEIAERL